MVQSTELVPIHNIWLDTSRLSVHRKRYYDQFREKVLEAEKDVAEGQKHTREQSFAGE